MNYNILDINKKYVSPTGDEIINITKDMVWGIFPDLLSELQRKLNFSVSLIHRVDKG